MKFSPALAKRYKLFDCLLLLVLTIVLIRPLFRLKYLNNWPSIESTFIADGRMLRDHFPHPGWQPLWYCGTRFDYIYPPALRYGTALISVIGHTTTARAYHLYTAVFYTLGIVAVYWLVLAGSASRGSAWLAAVATALVSPSFLFLEIIRNDSLYWVPQRLHVLMGYGEGPHISALSVLPAALAFSFVALRSGSRRAFAVAAVLCALTVSNNFYGATSLAMLFPLVVWSVWLAERRPAMWLVAAGIPALAYLLCASWLTPSYVAVTMRNLEIVAVPGNTKSRLIALAVIAVFGACSFWWGNRRPERSWTIFTIGAALVFSLYILGYYYFGLRIVGDAPRLIPEFDLAVILLFAELARRMWQRSKLRLVVVPAVVLALLPASQYLQHAYQPFPKAESLNDVYEYRMTQWLHDHLAGERLLPSGSLRFWFDAWFDNAQMTGGSEQGLLNRLLPGVNYQITAGERADLAVLWLQGFGTDAVIVSDQHSLDAYRDHRYPEKFRGVLQPLYNNGHGTIVYRVPRWQPGIGRVVDRGKIDAAAAPFANYDLAGLRNYVSIVEEPHESRAVVRWNGFDEVTIEASVANGQSVLLQETYDKYWRAYEHGRRLAIRPDPLNFMLIDVPEGGHDIEMRFETPLENRIGQICAWMGLLIAGWMWISKSAPPTPPPTPVSHRLPVLP